MRVTTTTRTYRGDNCFAETKTVWLQLHRRKWPENVALGSCRSPLGCHIASYSNPLQNCCVSPFHDCRETPNGRVSFSLLRRYICGSWTHECSVGCGCCDELRIWSPRTGQRRSTNKRMGAHSSARTAPQIADRSPMLPNRQLGRPRT